MRFHEQLRQARIARGWTQKELAKRVGTTPISITRWETGLTVPGSTYRKKLGEILEMNGEDLELWQDEKSQRPSHFPTRKNSSSMSYSALQKGAMTKQMSRPLKELIGRQQDIERFLQVFEQKNTRLFTIVGPAGVGKTQFALHLAYNLQFSFSDGVYSVFLDSLLDPSLVLPTLLQALGVTEIPSQSNSETLCSFIAEKKLLVLLDNFEHLLPAASLLLHLLDTCPHLIILVTSRAGLKVPGEQQFPLFSLKLPDPTSHTLEILAQSPALALFVARTRTHQPHFQLTADNAGLIARICTYLGGLPLAIELAATTGMQLFPPKILLKGLEQHPLRFLINEEQASPERQRTWTATIDWSYSLLKPEEQRLFRCLSLFSGGATLEAVEAVYQRSNKEQQKNIVQQLMVLVNHHLVLPPSESVTDSVHFRMLPVIRAYARDRLDAEAETQKTVQSYLTYFLALVKEIEPQLSGANQLQGLDLLEQEQDNLRAVFNWLMEHDKIENALFFTAALWRFWSYRGSISEGYQQIEYVLKRCQGETISGIARAKAHYAAALLAYFQRQSTNMREHLQSCIQLYQEVGDRYGSAIALNAMGYWELLQGHYKEVRACYEESLPILQEVDDHWHLAEVYALIAGEAQVQGNYIQAQKLYEQSVAFIRTVGDRRALIQGLDFLGQVFFHLKEYETALPIYKEKAFMAIELGGQPLIAACLEAIAEIAVMFGLERWAALLGGAAEALREASWGVISHEEQQRVDRLKALLAVVLDEPIWTSIWAQGRMLTPQQVLLAEPHEKRFQQESTVMLPPSHHVTGYPDALTVREVQVLRLIAAGLTNMQIAQKLVISHHTVNAHLNKIYAKIHVTSRSGAVRYALDNKLL